MKTLTRHLGNSGNPIIGPIPCSDHKKVKEPQLRDVWVHHPRAPRHCPGAGDTFKNDRPSFPVGRHLIFERSGDFKDKRIFPWKSLDHIRFDEISVMKTLHWVVYIWDPKDDCILLYLFWSQKTRGFFRYLELVLWLKPLQKNSVSLITTTAIQSSKHHGVIYLGSWGVIYLLGKWSKFDQIKMKFRGWLLNRFGTEVQHFSHCLYRFGTGNCTAPEESLSRYSAGKLRYVCIPYISMCLYIYIYISDLRQRNIIFSATLGNNMWVPWRVLARCRALLFRKCPSLKMGILNWSPEKCPMFQSGNRWYVHFPIVHHVQISIWANKTHLPWNTHEIVLGWGQDAQD